MMLNVWICHILFATEKIFGHHLWSFKSRSFSKRWQNVNSRFLKECWGQTADRRVARHEHALQPDVPSCHGGTKWKLLLPCPRGCPRTDCFCQHQHHCARLVKPPHTYTCTANLNKLMLDRLLLCFSDREKTAYYMNLCKSNKERCFF